MMGRQCTWTSDIFGHGLGRLALVAIVVKAQVRKREPSPLFVGPKVQVQIGLRILLLDRQVAADDDGFVAAEQNEHVPQRVQVRKRDEQPE